MPKLFLAVLVLSLILAGGLLAIHQLELDLFPSNPVITPGALRVTLSKQLGTLTVNGIVAETNRQRATEKIPPLSHNTLLDHAAQKKADDILARQYFDHVAPDGAGPADLVEQVNYAYLRVGENLALGAFSNDAILVQAWMNSPGHRANILSTRFDEIGIGIARGRFEGQEAWVAVQAFAQPASRCLAPSTQERKIIETKRAELEQLATHLEQTQNHLTTLIERINRGDGSPQEIDSFNDQQTAYNNQVSHYNALQADLRSRIDTLNEAIRQYNACLQ